jgi:Helix-turn-helix domain
VALSRTDVVLHPVRSRIVRSLLGSERRTASELTRLLPDVPLASLYRHLGALVDGKVLRVVGGSRGNSGGRSYRLMAAAGEAGHRQATVYLDDAEFDELVRGLAELVDAAVARGPGPGRTPRLLATVAVPLDGTPSDGAAAPTGP